MTRLHTARSWKIIPVMAAGWLLLGLQLTGMSAASAASLHPVAPLANTMGVQPDTTPSGEFRVYFPTQPSGGYVYLTCTPGHEGNNPAPSLLEPRGREQKCETYVKCVSG